MKILLDENIDVKFKAFFPADKHSVFTVRDMSWNGIKNGALLQLLKEHEFGCFIVVDKNLPYQQNTKNLPCPILVLDVFRNTLKNIQPLIPQVLSVLDNSIENKIIIISEN